MTEETKKKLDRLDALYPKERLEASKFRWEAMWSGNRNFDRYLFTFNWPRFNPYNINHPPEERVQAYLDGLLFTGHFQDDLITAGKRTYRISFFQQWASAGPDTAIYWLTGNQQELDQGLCQDYYQAIVAGFATKDLSGTAQWLAAQPNDGQLDKALRYFALRIQNENPANAEQWAETIKDPAIYSNTVAQLKQSATITHELYFGR